MPKITELDIAQIESNTKNYRSTYHKIEELAESIVKYGLLQNLVVVEYEPGKFRVHAGERRYRAIKLLCQQNDMAGNPRWQGPVPCILVTQYGLSDFEENDKRQKTAIWDDGERFMREQEETGADQTTIAAKVGKTQSYISQCIIIYRGLHPKVRKILSNIGPDALPNKQLLLLVKHQDAHGDPDEDAQMAALYYLLGKDRKKRRPAGSLKNEREAILSRVKHLETKRVPLHAKPYVDQMIAYLKGERKRLSF